MSMVDHSFRKNILFVHVWLLLFIGVFSSCRPSEPEAGQGYSAGTESPAITNDISNQQIKAFAEDAQGYIWLGTFRGLNKYNVHEYHQYFCTDDSLGLPDNQITDILLDSKGRMWVATVNGVCIYTDKDNFQRIPFEHENKNVHQLMENREGHILVTTEQQLFAYNPDRNRLDCVLTDLDPQQTFNTKCHIDNENNLWVVNYHLLRRYNASTMQLLDSVATKNYSYHSFLHGDELWLTGNQALSIFDTRTRQYRPVPDAIAKHPLLASADIDYIHPYGSASLLLNTTKYGMFCYNYKEGTVTHQNEDGFPFEVPRFKINQMFTDSQQNLWIGSVDQGFTVCYNYKERFNNNNYLRSRLENKSVVSIAVSKEQNLWISTLMDGLFVYNMRNQKMESIDMDRLSPQARKKAVYVNQLLVDHNDAIWMSITDNEVLKCRYVNGRLDVESRFQVFLPMSITEDDDKTIWIGTASSYVYALRQGENKFRAIQAFDTRFTFIPGLLPLHNGNLLVAAFYQPMKLINRENNEFSRLEVTEEDMKSSIQRSVFIPTALHEDSKGDIWIGTVSNGLLCYTPSTGKIRPVPGSPCLDISSIEEDAQGHLWVSTLYGLGKYDRTVGSFTNYYAADGIGGNQFYDRASCRLPDGTMIFGGTHGLTFFNPLDVLTKRHVPLLFEDLKVHNRRIHPNEADCIDKHLSYRPDIRLSHEQNGFSISFAALDYCEFERVHYHYMLEGFDNYWVDAHNNREAYYANLPAGTYTFRVKITNNDKSIVDTESSIRVIVEPAPWNTWWAYLIYFICAAAVILLFLRAMLRIKAEKEAAHLAKLEKEQEQRVNQMNMSFFANVSHEFRTPLTMISAPIIQLCNAQDITGENKNLLNIVQRSVTRMLRLVNQLMDFNKLENDSLKLKVERMDIIATLQRQVDIFCLSARDKGISLNTYGLEDTFLMWLDEDNVDKVFANLMSNALKFTPEGGSINVTFDLINQEEAARLFSLKEAEKDMQYIKVCVANTGQSIPEDQLEKIFERYYQLANQTEGRYNWGTGIGLYYARSLVKLHHGHIKASTPDEGSGAVFTFILPVNDSSYAEEERVSKQTRQSEIFPLEEEHDVYNAENQKPKGVEEKKSILVVDDDTEVVHYLKTLLSPRYHIICRFNVDSALKTMQEEAPDLILSDVVMPDKDGYNLCREVKDNLQLCHIPVILVTAKATLANQVEGLNIGADAYVTKPFDPDYLLALVNSQLKNRDKVRNLLSQSTQTDKIEENILSPQDNAFMTDLYHLMENELSDSELDVVRMTELLHISRTKFYYKVKGLTGVNPSVFFKTYKLNRAAELINEGKYTVSEIADMTGFSTLSHFSASFKKHFGTSPSEYHKP